MRRSSIPSRNGTVATPTANGSLPEPNGNGSLPSPFSFRVEVQPERDVVRVCPVGEVDLATVDDVRARMDEVRASGFTHVVLDLRDTTFLDSTGLRLVIEAHASSAADGWEFGLIEGPAEVQRVFEIAGLCSRLPFVDPSS